MTQALAESRKWLLSSPGQVRKARDYFVEAEKCAILGGSEWQLEPQSISTGLLTRIYPFDITSPRSTTAAYLDAVTQLVRLLELPNGWDSYNARAVSKDNVLFALGLLAKIMRDSTPAPQIVPRVRGGVQLEWHTQGIDIEIAIDSPEAVSFFAESRLSGNGVEEEQLDEQSLSHWIAQLSG
jgi:hypothetical protein